MVARDQNLQTFSSIYKIYVLDHLKYSQRHLELHETFYMIIYCWLHSVKLNKNVNNRSEI